MKVAVKREERFYAQYLGGCDDRGVSKVQRLGGQMSRRLNASSVRGITSIEKSN
ncbi:MAG: hypothetical protein N2045_09905 [Fimbriimonadales bacterium]|jgi:hypothetical protein|nr:hypothetical protein [Fimbriimonadales bacterium]